MSKEIKVSINLTIKGKDIHLTVEEVKELKEVLDAILENKNNFIPSFPIPRTPIDEKFPWKDPYTDKPWVTFKTSIVP